MENDAVHKPAAHHLDALPGIGFGGGLPGLALGGSGEQEGREDHGQHTMREHNVSFEDFGFANTHCRRRARGAQCAGSRVYSK